jgi:hypothetical protein
MTGSDEWKEHPTFRQPRVLLSVCDCKHLLTTPSPRISHPVSKRLPVCPARGPTTLILLGSFLHNSPKSSKITPFLTFEVVEGLFQGCGEVDAGPEEVSLYKISRQMCQYADDTMLFSCIWNHRVGTVALRKTVFVCVGTSLSEGVCVCVCV